MTEATDLHPELAEPEYGVLHATVQREQARTYTTLTLRTRMAGLAPPIKGQHTGNTSATTSPLSSRCG